MSLWALSRRASTRLFCRNYAELVPSGSTVSPKSDPAQPPQTSDASSSQVVAPLRFGTRVPVREDHGLYAFFREKEPGKDGKTVVGEARYETIGGSIYQENVQSGRSWKAAELRLKSFHDLHTLWYVLLRERNLLATQKEEARRLGAAPILISLGYKTRQCRKSMARIKYVLNERRLAYEGAVQLAEKEKEDHLDQVVLQHQLAEYRKERKFMARREAGRATTTDASETEVDAGTIEHPTENAQTSTTTTTTTNAPASDAAKAGLFGQN
ncbi:54S ribosomal protein L4 mitochondrial [Marasmius sp. AFHP31]|nr:54S ribosomal protein L4 mitochondrial [Marasmius sp. AFHP31]